MYVVKILKPSNADVLFWAWVTLLKVHEINSLKYKPSRITQTLSSDCSTHCFHGLFSYTFRHMKLYAYLCHFVDNFCILRCSYQLCVCIYLKYSVETVWIKEYKPLSIGFIFTNENAQRRCKPVWGLGPGYWEGFLCWLWSAQRHRLRPGPLHHPQTVYTGRIVPAYAHSGLDQCEDMSSVCLDIRKGKDIRANRLTLNFPTNLSSVAPSSSLAFPLNSSYVFTQSSKGPNSASSSLLYSCRDIVSIILTFPCLTFINVKVYWGILIMPQVSEISSEAVIGIGICYNCGGRLGS